MTSALRFARLISIAMLAWLTAGALWGTPVQASAAAARVRLASASHRAAATVAWPGTPFAPDSVWNRPLGDQAALSPNSRAFVGEVVRQVDDYGPWLNTYAYSVPVYLVPAGQPTIPVTLDTWGPDLEAAFAAVPLPADATPAQGSDEQLTVWQPSTNTMWEFWKLHKVHGAWHARWGGEMQDVSQNPGYFTHTAATDDWGPPPRGFPCSAA